MQVFSKSPEQTFALGLKIGKALKKGDTLYLIGDLGGGKTTFTKGLAKGIGIKQAVQSPSFVISKIYNGRTPLAHFDFYRLENPDPYIRAELDEIIKSKESVVIVEWAERLGKNRPKAKKIITFHYIGPEERQIVVNNG